VTTNFILFLPFDEVFVVSTSKSWSSIACGFTSTCWSYLNGSGKTLSWISVTYVLPQTPKNYEPLGWLQVIWLSLHIFYYLWRELLKNKRFPIKISVNIILKKMLIKKITLSGVNYKQILLFRFIRLSMYLDLIKTKYISYSMNLKSKIYL
jgi:hypothetical protein